MNQTSLILSILILSERKFEKRAWRRQKQAEDIWRDKNNNAGRPRRIAASSNSGIIVAKNMKTRGGGEKQTAWQRGNWRHHAEKASVISID